MDYKDKYNEALERAKRLRDSFYQTMNAKRVVDEIFPELAESEDERIRKWIYELIQALGEPADEEAQKQKEIPLMNGDADFYFDEWNQQKPNPTKRQCFEEGMKYAQRLQKEQTLTEWSEFDKCTLEDAICATDLLGNDESFNKGNPNLAKAFRVAKDWLKSLPERFSLQPKVEWNAEDNEVLQQVIADIEDLITAETSPGFLAKYNKHLAWLKSLLPQPRWKPSEEQMSALNYFIKLWGNSDDQLEYTKIFNNVKSLRDDLEKLM